MTLATVPRYDGERLSRGDGHALVVGGSVAGLCAARVLADEYRQVTVVDRDPLPTAPAPRDGAPQGAHPHALQEAGRATLEDLFPGYGEALVSAGGLIIDAARDFRFYDEGGFLADGPRRMPMYTASRPLFERVLCERVADLDGVQLRGESPFTEYLLDERRGRVTGAVVRDETGTEEALAADLVVDATGRASRTPAWLADHGYERPPVDEVHVDLEYSTLLVERPPDERYAIWGPATPPNTKGAGAAPIEGGRWQVVLQGVHGTSPPADPDEFEAFAAGLQFPDVERLLRDHPRHDDEVRRYPFPSNRRHRYGALDQLPEGLVVTGDAVASFNPVYGQGISVAALEALVLHHVLADGGRTRLGERYFDRVSPVVDIAWTMAVGADFQFPQTTGPKPRGADLVARYLSRLTRRAHTDGRLRDALFRVIMMERDPTTLLRPGVLWRVLRPGG
jgi:2-polyprenyl-6-methoxyphenol hydroxylase-like FAD-dependent oxidoreductase